MIYKSTKTFYNLPCSHQQYQDADASGIPGTGQCAQTHGYSRSFHFEFSCTSPDAYGWVVGFSSLKKVDAWLKYMFDHTSLWEAGDPRLTDVKRMNGQISPSPYRMRILPSGVSMEQTSLFVALHVNPYILNQTADRCWVSKIEVRENDKNSGILEMTRADAINMRSSLASAYNVQPNLLSDEHTFPRRDEWPSISPADLDRRINQGVNFLLPATLAQ